jgi:hypothetical protein
MTRRLRKGVWLKGRALVAIRLLRDEPIMSFAVRARSPNGSIISVCVSKAELALEVSRRMAALQAKQITIYVGATGRSYRRCSSTGHFSTLEENSRIMTCGVGPRLFRATLSPRERTRTKSR